MNIMQNGKEEEFQKNFKDSQGYQPLMTSGTNNKEKRKSSRVEANWRLFKEGIYSGNGYTLDTSKYIDSSPNVTSIEGLNLYNSDGTVNKKELETLYTKLTAIVNSDRSEYNGLQYKQCTWWCAKRADMYLKNNGTVYKSYPKNGNYGNGREWYNKNATNGWFNYGKIPRANSIIVWTGGSGQWAGYGHVAYVEAVDTKNKKIYISEAGGGDYWCSKIREFTYDNNGDPHYKDTHHFQGYIYLDSPKAKK